MSTHEPRWVSRAIMDAVHADLLKTFGGAEGTHDVGLLDSALSRARNRYLHADSVSLAELCACYGYGIVKDHPYIDGNKRCAFAAMMIFAEFNGMTIRATEDAVVAIMLDVASSKASEGDLVEWLNTCLVPHKADALPSR